MLSKYNLRAVALIYGFFGAQFVFATEVSSNISADTTWSAPNNPYVITNSIFQVDTGVTLTVQAGVIIQFSGTTVFNVNGTLDLAENVQIRFANASSMIINGTLNAIGTSTNPITLSPADPLGAWMSIQFADTSTDASYSGQTYTGGSTLQYVIMDKCGIDGVGGFPTTSGCIELIGAHPYINFVTISNGEATGISAKNINGNLRIHNSTIHDNSDNQIDESGGIYVHGLSGSNVQILGNVIYDNASEGVAGGVAVFDAGVLRVEGNQIQNNDLIVAHDGGGGLAINNFNVSPVSTHQVLNNTISGNSSVQNGGGAWLDQTDVNFKNNRVANNIATSGNGGGIYVYRDTSIVIQNNIISGNDADSAGGGIYVSSLVQTPPTIETLAIQQNVVSSNSSLSSNTGGIDIQGGDITLTENIIADNQAVLNNVALRLSAAGVAQQNSIIRNNGNSTIRISLPQNENLTNLLFSQNTVVENVSSSVVIGSTVDDVAQLPVISGNNIWSNGIGFYISHSDPATTIDATNNYFGTNDLLIAQDNVSGLVTVDPIAITPFTDVPISPPISLSIQKSGDTVTLNWVAPPESDLAGFRVYWKNSQNTDYTLVPSGDVGVLTSHMVSGLSPDLNYYFAVTAYDAGYSEVSDVNTTITNDNQTDGSESWFSNTVSVARTTNSGGGGGGGGGGIGLLLLTLIAPVLLIRKGLQ